MHYYYMNNVCMHYPCWNRRFWRTAQGQNLHKQVTSCNDIQIDSCKTIGRVIKIIIVMIQGAPPPPKKKMGEKPDSPCDLSLTIILLRHTQGARKGTVRWPWCSQKSYNPRTAARQTQGLRTASIRPTYGRSRGVYGMATACQISTANVEMKKVITPRYNSTATPAACKS